MKNSPLPFQKTESRPLSVKCLDSSAQGWMLSGEIAQHSPATLAKRRIIVKNLLWFLRQREYEECGLNELRAFFGYLSSKKPEPSGRWGNPRQTQPVKPGTVATYYATLNALFNWLVAEGEIDASPMTRIPAPIDRPDQIQPFTTEQVQSLLSAAKKSQHPKRDEAILLMLLDTGVRSSELCALRLKDVDMSARRASVEGKGGKSRPIYFSKTTAKSLWNYLRQDERDQHDPLFFSERGEALTRSGLQQVLERLEKAAGLTAVRCSPHTFRHTAGILFIKAGGSQFALMQMLGHTDLKMTARYVKLAEADVENQHREFSPVEAMKGRKQ